MAILALPIVPLLRPQERFPQPQREECVMCVRNRGTPAVLATGFSMMPRNAIAADLTEVTGIACVIADVDPTVARGR